MELLDARGAPDCCLPNMGWSDGGCVFCSPAIPPPEEAVALLRRLHERSMRGVLSDVLAAFDIGASAASPSPGVRCLAMHEKRSAACMSKLKLLNDLQVPPRTCYPARSKWICCRLASAVDLHSFTACRHTCLVLNCSSV